MAADALDAGFKLSTAPLTGGGKPLARALVVSILVHLLLLALWLTVERREERDTPELVAIPFEMIEPPAPPVPAPAPPPPPSVAERPPPPPPQLREAEAAERSSAPQESAPPAPTPTAPPPARPQPRAETPPPRPAPTASPQRLADGLLPPPAPPQTAAAPPPPIAIATLNARPRTPAERDAARPPAGLPSERVTQAESDFLLAQILRNWLLDYASPRFHEITLTLWFTLGADGTVDVPVDRFGAIDFRRTILEYDALVQAAASNPMARDFRSALETFVSAVRAAQPFRPQPGRPHAAGPRAMLIEFKMGDLPPRG
jgi:hypothetical protein